MMVESAVVYIVFFLGLIGGFALGFMWSSRKKGASKEEFENLLKQESAAQEKIKIIVDELNNAKDNHIQNQQMIIALNKQLAQAQAVLPQWEESLKDSKKEREQLRTEVVAGQSTIANLNARASCLETEKTILEQQLVTLKSYVDEMRKQTKLEFETLAHQILDAKAKSFSETTEKNLDMLLKPLQEKIHIFEKAVDEKYTNEAKERHALKSEIEKLITLNDKMTFETHSLTQALRGDSKVQGDWGELVLERILETSGLREGQEYSLQKSHQSDEGDRFRPDVVINLPENKHIIVDSKVSLKAYDLFRSSDNSSTHDKCLLDHIKSIEKHVDDLGAKHYAKLKGVYSPEIVFMFVPIEPAYLLAMKHDPELSARAWKKGVAIVTATTLLTSLKTVASIWRLEKQNKNALEIANEGAKLYDKFVGFLEDFEKIGKTFDTGQRQYADAMSKLKDGSGNIFRRIETMRELGAAPTKKIRPELLE